MGDKKSGILNQIIMWIVIIVGVVMILQAVTSSHNEEAVRTKIKDYLYEKYGEEFVVDRIGQRRRRGEVFYQARIYPEAIVGTNKWGG